MSRIPDDTLNAIRDRVDIVDLIGRHVGLKKAGRTWKGLCPFHGEKTPSFVVSPDRGTYHCFGCGEGGNVFGFLMKHDGMTFPEAARSLAAEVGIEVPELGGGPERGVLDEIYRANKAARAFYQAELRGPRGAAAREYVAKRGLTEEDLARYGIGYAPESWDALVNVMRREKIAPEAAERAGLIRARERGGGHYDLLRNRLVFPIEDARGRTIGFGGRALAKDQEPKYLNTPESPVYRKREAFYGLPSALESLRTRERAVIVEGYFDRIAMDRAGVGEALATCGTALSEDHARALRRRVRDVVMFFDGDEAGQRAMLRSLEMLLPQGLRISAATIPGGLDPDEFLAEHGAEALQKLVDDAESAIRLAMRRAVTPGIASPQQVSAAVGAMVPILALIPDPAERGEWTRLLAITTNAQRSDVDESIRIQRKAASMGRDSEEAPAVPPRKLTAAERHFCDALRILVDHPASARLVTGDQLAGLVSDETLRSLAFAVHRVSLAGRSPSELVDALEGDARGRFLALVSEARPDLEDEAKAERIFRDELVWLAREQQRERSRALTQSVILGSTPTEDLITLKQRELEQRRAARGLPPG
ncbi:MAG: DNA primase [Deltaproteobacteria bacterium]|nr:DNA primase [Deltaproteobacteria bacterium]